MKYAAILGTALGVMMPMGVSAQGMNGIPGFPMGAAGAMGMGQAALESFPGMVDETMGALSTMEGRVDRKTEESCLTGLQAVINIGAMAGNLIPFASAGAYEAVHGPTGRIRALVDGEKLNLEIYCEGSEMVTKRLDWDEKIGEDVTYERGSLDAVLGISLLAAMDGAFSKTRGDAPLLGSVSPSVGEDKEAGIVPVTEMSPEQEELFNGFSTEMGECWETDGLLGIDKSAKAVVVVPMDDESYLLPDDAYAVGTESEALNESALASIDECVGKGKAPIDIPKEWVAVHFEFSDDGVKVLPAVAR